MTARLLVRCGAEIIGTALLVGLVTGPIVALVLGGGGPLWVLALTSTAAVALPIALFVSVSGAHLNPAVTWGLVCAQGFPARDAMFYTIAQVGGAFLGSLGVLFAFGENAHLGATFPHGVGLPAVFVLELGFTFLLVSSVVLAPIIRKDVRRMTTFLPALVVGLATILIGPYTGSSLNPVRTLAPGLLSGTFDAIGIYLIATSFGGVAAGVLWSRFVRNQSPVL